MPFPLELRDLPQMDSEHSTKADRHEGNVGLTLGIGSLPHENTLRGWISMLISLCAGTAALAMVLGHSKVGAVLLFSCTAALVWRFCAETETDNARRRPKNIPTVFMAALTVMIVALGVWLSGSWLGYGSRGPTSAAGTAAGRKTGRTSSSADTSYFGIILWPKPPQKAKVVPPQTHARTIIVARISKPLVIPFQGSYWYFRSPAKRPGRRAHVAHGSPISVDIHSSEYWRPINMEAHQILSAPIDLTCCREIDIDLRNGDNIPGQIRIAVNLIDTSSPRARYQYLGVRSVLSSEQPEFSLGRPPVNEVLRYPIPANPSIRYFDEIEVVFLPAQERALSGVKVAIRDFQLLPAY